jgi:hypothetical protein
LGPNVVILEGIVAGATVVADNVEGLTDGMQVAPRKTPPAGGGQ